MLLRNSVKASSLDAIEALVFARDNSIITRRNDKEEYW